MKFIGRAKELSVLEKEYQRDTSSFVVMYGRWRVGKTTLIHEFCKDKKVIFFLATEENEKQNQNAFRMKIAQATGSELLKISSINDWSVLFKEIAGYCRDERVVVVIDEFQYLGKVNPAFPSILMKIWDEFLGKSNIMLILCGSLINMMISQVLNYDSPLYGRRTAQMKMQQIPFSYYHEFMPDASKEQLIMHYAITGGVPKYIELFDKNEDIYEEIKENILSQTSFLYEEPVFLLQKEVVEIGRYFTLIKTIAAGNHKLSHIASAIGIKQTSIIKYLKTLQDLDILERQVPVTEENPEKSKKGLYFLKDNYFRFWFYFIYPYRDMIENGQEDYVMDKIKSNLVDRHVAYVYEDICREEVWQLLNDDRFNISFNRVGRWWGNKDVEIDIVAYDSLGSDILFGECKYSKKPKDVDVYYKLKEKSQYVTWNNQHRKEYFVLYSKSGFSDQLKDLANEKDNLLLIQNV